MLELGLSFSVLGIVLGIVWGDFTQGNLPVLNLIRETTPSRERTPN